MRPSVETIHIGFLIAECIESIGEGYQSISIERVIFHILDIVTRDGSSYAVPLSQDVVHLQGDGGVFPFQELIRSLCVSQPALCIVSGRISGRSAVSYIGS